MTGSSMNASIKSNLSLLRSRNRKKLKNTLGGYNPNLKTEYNLPKASSKQLRDIRKRMQSERRLWWIKMVVVTAILLLGLVVLFNLNSEQLSQLLWY